MSDELFRARVEPRRAHAPTVGAPPPGDGRADDHADEVLDDLMASFERRRNARFQDLDDDPFPARRDSPDAGSSDEASRSSSSSLSSLSSPGDAWTGTDPATLPSRRSVVPRRRARDPWLAGGAALAITAGVAAAVMSSPLFGHDAGGERSTVATTSLGTPTAPGTPAASATSSTVHSLLSTAVGPSDGAPDPAAAASAQAAAWIAAYVGAGNVVACDRAMCGLLQDRHFPAGALVTVQSSLVQVERADVVVVTDVLRRQLGAGLAGVVAAEPLAVFRSDTSTVAIVPVALNGTAAYTAQLAADRAARRSAGAQLLHNTGITLTGAARAALASGQVDGRVCDLLAALGGSHKITVEAFTGAGPGAGPDVPLPGVVVSEFDGAPAVGSTAKAAQLRTIVNAQRPPYAPLSVAPVAAGTGQGLAIVFAQPVQFGLLPGTTP